MLENINVLSLLFTITNIRYDNEKTITNDPDQFSKLHTLH